MIFHVKQDEEAENHLSWWETSSSTGWAGGRTVSTASCWLTRPEQTKRLESTSKLQISPCLIFVVSKGLKAVGVSRGTDVCTTIPGKYFSRGINHCFAYWQRGSSEFVSSYRPAKGPVPFTWSGTCLIKQQICDWYTSPPCIPYTPREPRVHLRGESGPTWKTSKVSRWKRIQSLTGGGANKSSSAFTAFVVKVQAASSHGFQS